MTRWTRLLLAVGLIAAVGLPNYDILRKQRIVEHGTQVLLELRPADPRSLMQGDYMSLSYHAQAFPPPDASLSPARRGALPVANQHDIFVIAVGQRFAIGRNQQVDGCIGKTRQLAQRSARMTV